jgi:hypothetical protein
LGVAHEGHSSELAAVSRDEFALRSASSISSADWKRLLASLCSAFIVSSASEVGMLRWLATARGSGTGSWM